MRPYKIFNIMIRGLLSIALGIGLMGGVFYRDERSASAAEAETNLIRFHVIANSDTDEDQALKKAVRDEILKEVSPRLAVSQSLDESRRMLSDLMPLMAEQGKKVVAEWGKDYEVKVELGIFPFPTKSYGSLILPSGEYEAVKVVIGKGAGANWWCVLFPPLCFVDIDAATAVPVDTVQTTGSAEKDGKKPAVKFWVWEKLKKLF